MDTQTSSVLLDGYTHTPGVHAGASLCINMPDTIYHKMLHRQSCSMLKAMLLSPAHYMASIGLQMKSTDEMVFGTLVHSLVLEPGLTFQRFSVYPEKIDRRDRAAKEFLAKHGSMLVVDEPTYELALAARERILDRRFQGRPFSDWLSEGVPEAVIYYTDPVTGIECRVRVDLLHPEFVFDLKTTAYAEGTKWLRHSLGLHYDLQAHMYSLAAALHSGSPRPFVFVTCESDQPLSVSMRTAGETYMESGAKKYQNVITSLYACQKADLWPALDEDEVLEISPWQSPDEKPAWAQALGK